ncbi:galactose-specific lectin nattectin-like [Halichoeres trimaculatus]|uniref:galactose-specific lectin nattectin-like n=1 Tax=Halichoeres trimaculatus TaxID=147232 RepID=UPI003D9DC481
MASSLQVVFLLSLTSGLFIAGAISQAQQYKAPAFPPGCPPHWTQFDDRCFNFFRMAKPWAEAQTYCIKLGGNLASIHSHKENHFLSEFIEQVTGVPSLDTWIGASDAEQEKRWFWIDGTPFDYQFWSHGQPDDYKNNEDCLQMNFAGSAWNDRPCFSSLPYVCVKDVQTSTH